jgi:NADH-quinone oxidoreductase subunit I
MHPVMKTINKVCNLGNNTLVEPVTEIIRGMSTVMVHAFRPSVTIEYPEVRPDLSERFKGRLALLRKPDGSEMCVGCKMCTRVCPCMDLIVMETHKEETPDGKSKVVVDKHTIDMGRCILCGNCVEVCPVNCLVFTHVFDYADYSRESLVYTKEMFLLSPEESEEWRKLHKEGNS